MSFRILPLALVMTAGLAASTVHAATTGILNFKGQVDAGTCNLAAGDVNRTITLPTVKVSDFDSVNFTGEHDFEISADCESDIRNVIFLFAGTVSTGNGLLFANAGTSAGTALWLAHRTSTLATIPANGTPAQRSRTVPTSDNKAVLPLRAAYHKTGAAISQGSLVSAVTVSITYN
ncbi:pilus assembly protein [Pseudomonas poae]|uniref:Pilus assembly protein n=1 Tax=Pseudomonas poae TaxID=200451 RepID=A0A423F5G4_9PSED|nr:MULTISPECIES: fimbrial protein [Pseudomonas]ROM49909.1 pilus assembly protein [Pseudomonas poae]TFF04951.1 type 1 fimbrial protein [Pseudomonas sp. JMN1]TFF06429.1 type 1 fimbrial protein [Pseudomonas sp. BCA17]TFF22418.1 type 1 fimbrial protein [Pseudomonas sp. BCA14]TFF26815.1 type 1 fimbrial protein [Pseudomonas sp. BCA13]